MGKSLAVSLDSRLLTAASLVREGHPVCDVGTDHGMLAVWLLQNKITDRVTACDINAKPLAAAMRTAQKYGVEDRICLRLSDGLSAIPESEAQDIVICGMGGELIAKILSECPYVKEKSRRLILQPMTQIPFLRRYLCSTGFDILRECATVDRRHVYTILHCAYTGRCREIDDWVAYTGKMPQEKSAAARQWLLQETQRLSRIAKGLAAGKQAHRSAYFAALSQRAAAVSEEMKKEENT